MYIFSIVLFFNFSQAQPSGYYHIAGMNSWSGATMSDLGLGTTKTRTIEAANNNNEFLISWDDYYNKWYNQNITSNTLMTLTFSGGGGANSIITSGVTSGKYYTFNIDVLAYSSRQAIVMETSAAPVSITSVSSYSYISPGQDIYISIGLSDSKSTEEKVFVRYTADSWSSWNVAEVVGNDDNFSTGVATIPASVNAAGSTIEYYVYSTTVAAEASSNHDLIALKFNNNSGSNYSYSVNSQNYSLMVGSLSTGDAWDVAISGIYAYIASGLTVKILDVSDLSNPYEVGSYSVSYNAYGVFISGNYLYVADGTSGLKILDVTDKTNPTLLGSIDYNAGVYDWQSSYKKVIVSGDYAYVAAYKYFYVFDISDPTNISQTGTFTCAAGCNDFDLDGNYVYLANSYYGLEILDISTPSNPTEVGSYNDITGSLASITDVVKSGNYAYAIKSDNTDSSSTDKLYVYNVSTPSAPSLLSSISYNDDTDTNLIPRGISFDGTYTYSHLQGQIQVHDVSDVNSPTFYSFIETNGMSYHSTIREDYIFAANRSSGIQIIDSNLLKSVSKWTNTGGDNLWSNTANWIGNTLPTSNDDVTILNGNSITIDILSAVARSINIVPGATLTINPDARLTVSNNFSNTGTTTLNSNSSNFSALKLSTSSKQSGNITYNRYVNTVGTGEWDLIGSPVNGLTIESFVTANSGTLATGDNAGTTVYALGIWDNSTGDWSNYDENTYNVGNVSFDVGTGYQMASASGSTLAFTGTIANTDQTQSVIDNSGNGGSQWNLISNPFPSYLNGTNGADATHNFLKVNLDSGVIDGAFTAFYGWDADGTGYTPYNHTSGAVYIAPGQGFFVAAASASSADISFTEAMQTTTGGDDFVASRVANTSSQFYLKLYNSDALISDAMFYFDTGLTLGLDPGYDAGALDQSRALMSRLPVDDQGIGMHINAMGETALNETTIIPLVVNQPANTAFRISLEDATIAESVGVYLEDTQANTYTDLRAGDFILTPSNNLSDMGRFYLVVGSNSLGQNSFDTSYVSLYKVLDEDYITIEGLLNFESANMRLFNIIGQEVLTKGLMTGQVLQTVSTAGLETGLYIVKLKVDDKTITKKIILN